MATPLRWSELDDRRLGPRRWSVATVRARVAADGDPWQDIAAGARSLGPATRALARSTR